MKKVCIPSVFGCGALLFSLPALAEEGGKASLPQLDATLYLGQLFWLAICFPIFYVIIRWLAVPRIKQSQGNRHDILRVDLDAASLANEEAREIQSGYEAKLADARVNAQKTVNEIILSASKEASAQQSSQQQTLEKRMVEAESKIEAQRQSAFKEVKISANDLAVAIVEKLTGLKSASRGN